MVDSRSIERASGALNRIDDVLETRVLCVCSLTLTGVVVGLSVGSDVGVGVGARGADDDWAYENRGLWASRARREGASSERWTSTRGVWGDDAERGRVWVGSGRRSRGERRERRRGDGAKRGREGVGAPARRRLRGGKRADDARVRAVDARGGKRCGGVFD